MKRNYSQPSGEQTYRRLYSAFRGVDFANNPLNVDPSRMPFARNIIVDEKGVVHKRKGFKAFTYFLHTKEGYKQDEPFPTINGMWVFKPVNQEEKMIIHAGNNLYSFENDDILHIIHHIPGADNANWDYMRNAPSCGFQHGNRFYVLDGEHYYNYWFNDSDNQWTLEPVYLSATVPETQVAGYYYAEDYTDENDQPAVRYTWTWGEKEEKNLLTSRRINTFCGDGHNTKFFLDNINLRVLKVEQYSPTAPTPTGNNGTFTNGSSGSNVRDKASMKGTIIGHASANQAFAVLGKEGKWYKIQYNSTTVGYIHESRGTYADASGGSTDIAATEEWVEISSSNYSVAQVGAAGEQAGTDKVYNCTKITFTTAPNPHPRGNGLPNIRVTCVPVESGEVTITKDDLNANRVFYLTISHLAFADGITIEKNGSALANSNYSINSTPYHDHTLVWITFGSGVVGDNDTITIHYIRESMDGFDQICGCDKYGKYGEYNFDRYFVTGNTAYVNRDWYSEPNDPTLFLENSYTDIGDTATPIAGYLNMMSDMLIVKQDGTGETLFRRTARSSGDTTIFPVKAYQGKGAVSRYALSNIHGACLYLTTEGLCEFISSDLGTKYGTQNRSWLINDYMIREEAENYSGAYVTAYKDYVIIAFPSGHCYVADTNQQTAPSVTGGAGYEFFFWDGIWMSHSVEYDGDFFFSFTTADGDELYMVQGDDYADHYRDGSVVPIEAEMTTLCDQLDEPARYKYIERRGAIIHLDSMTQDIEIGINAGSETVPIDREEWVTQHEPTDFDLIRFHAAEYIPYVTINRRINRFRYIQFMFANNDPDRDGFGIISLEFQYRFGRYVI